MFRLQPSPTCDKNWITSNIIDFIQEMGRCGRQVSHYNEYNAFSVIFTLNDYIYLAERLYKLGESGGDNDCRFMSVEDKQQASMIRLNNLCQIMFLEYGYWHLCLEFHSSNPFISNTHFNVDNCKTNCPHCDGSIKNLVKKISRRGIEVFLSNIFIENNNGSITALQLAKKLHKFPQAGRLVYCRQSAMKPKKTMDASITVLQLLCSNILQLKITESNDPKSFVNLALTDLRPNYLDDFYWRFIRHYP